MKKYVAPVTEILKIESSSMICGSKIDREYDISDPNSDNPYLNPDWADSGDMDDDGDLNSTGKGNNNLWDDIDDEEW